MSPINKYIPIISDKEENTNQKKNTKILAVVKNVRKNVFHLKTFIYFFYKSFML